MKEGNKHVMGNEEGEGRKQTENEEEEEDGKEDEDEDEAMEVRTLISIFFLHTLLFSLTYEKFKKKKENSIDFPQFLPPIPSGTVFVTYLLVGSR